MKKLWLTIAFTLVLIPFGLASAEQVPLSVGGFTIGGDIEEFQDQLRGDTDLPIRHFESMHEVEIKPVPGFKSGLVVYQTCAQPGLVVQLRFKYADDSRDYYEELLKRFTRKFGEPDEWLGNSFGTVLAWKWSFEDSLGRSVSMTLQHNLGDEERKMGNSVKLSLPDLYLEEQRCFDAANPGEGSDVGGESDWNMLIPQ